MAFSNELHFTSASRLLHLLRSREISSVELTRAAYDRIRQVNPRLNAMVTLRADEALKEAAESDRRLGAGVGIRPLEGLPISIKDSIATAGVLSTDGMKILEHNVPDRDAPSVARYRQAGAVMLGENGGEGSKSFHT